MLVFTALASLSMVVALRGDATHAFAAPRRRPRAAGRTLGDHAHRHVPRLRGVEPLGHREAAAQGQVAASIFSIAAARCAGSIAKPRSFIVCAPMITASAIVATVW